MAGGDSAEKVLSLWIDTVRIGQAEFASVIGSMINSGVRPFVGHVTELT